MEGWEGGVGVLGRLGAALSGGWYWLIGVVSLSLLPDLEPDFLLPPFLSRFLGASSAALEGVVLHQQD